MSSIQNKNLHNPRPYTYYFFIYFGSAILISCVNVLTYLNPDSELYFFQIMMSLLFTSLYIFFPIVCASIIVYILKLKKTAFTFLLNLMLNIIAFAITIAVLSTGVETKAQILGFIAIGALASSLAWLSLPKLKSKI